MTKTKTRHHLRIEGDRLAMNSYTTYFLSGVDTTADGEEIVIDLHRTSDLAALREIAKKMAFDRGCRVEEAL
jgi:hypothetical protein